MSEGSGTDRHGDFGAFYAANKAGALRQAQRLVSDGATAEDIVSEAFSRIWARWGDGGIDEPARYLSRIVRNAATDHFRRLARERAAVARAAVGAGIIRESVAGVVEARQVVSGLLDQVSPTQRRAVSLRYLLDLSEAQTAQSLGVSLGTVKSSTSRGLHRMRALHQLADAA